MYSVIISDLDGTLLDQETYDYSPACPALEELKERNIPLVLCSSKTAAEMIPFRLEIQNRDPFIIENGGGIYIPKNYFSTIPLEAKNKNDFLLISLGRAYPDLQQALEEITEKYSLEVESFHSMSGEQLADVSGLSLDQAQDALRREFDLPFRLLSSNCSATQIEKEVQRRGLRLSRGGRFFHLSGDNDKGRAVHQLLELYQTNCGEAVQAIGFGDSHNDLSMLREVQIPVIIPNPYSLAPLTHELPRARKASAAGPRGWNDALLSLLREIDNGNLSGGS
ncbi:MAG: HAD-IIB family hydrolase [Acidobacteriota bacterium]